MDIKLVDRGDTGELLLSGRLDATNFKEVEVLFMQMADRFVNLTLDMKDLKFVSSAGLRSLLKLYMKIHAKGGELRAVNAAPHIIEVFEMTGFAEMLNIR